MPKCFTFIHTADLHQGIDFSSSKFKKGVKQRSDDFLNNFKIIIERSERKDIDFLVIAGDIFDRSKPKPLIKGIIIDKLTKLSQKKPVILIPGNHDKSKIEKGLLFLYPNLIIFNRPSIQEINIRGISISITGIPFIREDTLQVIERTITKSLNKKGDFNILILHELVESCTVGIMNFEFTKTMKKVVPISLIDQKFDYIALGHVHKYQKIEKAITPIYYAGSVERTSVVESGEDKGYIINKVFLDDLTGIRKVIPSFVPLPNRQMIYYKITSMQDTLCQLLLAEIVEKTSNHEIMPLVIINIVNLDNYEKYRGLKNHLIDLKSKNKIFDYSISSPDFRKKLQASAIRNETEKVNF